MPVNTITEPSIRIRIPQAEGLRRALAGRGYPTTQLPDALPVAGAVVHETGPA